MQTRGSAPWIARVIHVTSESNQKGGHDSGSHHRFADRIAGCKPYSRLQSLVSGRERALACRPVASRLEWHERRRSSRASQEPTASTHVQCLATGRMNAPHLQLVVMHSGHCKQHAEAEGGTFELTLAQHARPHVDQHHRHEGAYGSVENMPRAALRSAAAMRTAAEHGKHRPTGCHSSATKALSGDPSIAPQAAPSDALPETIAGKAGAARARATQCLRAAKSENVCKGSGTGIPAFRHPRVGGPVKQLP